MTDQKPPPLHKLGNVFIVISFLLIIIFQLPPTVSLLVGLVGVILFGNPFPKTTKTITKYLLQCSIIGLGFGMNFTKVMEAGREGFAFTILTIGVAIAMGFIIGRLLKVERIISYLISVGTAICGGSAIAAISQVIEADENDVSVSIGTVFILNAVALFIFPTIGQALNLSQQQFGIWSAIAIHDTSSVVGAASRYGNEALMIATTVKLARALWIIPLAIVTSFVFRRVNKASALPWFILLFVVASIINTYMKLPVSFTSEVLVVSKIGFSLTLFLIGLGITPARLKSVGVRPLLQGVLLWIIVLVGSLLVVTKI